MVGLQEGVGKLVGSRALMPVERKSLQISR